VDVLGDALAAMRTGQAHSRRNQYRESWGVRFESFSGAGFHVVLKGGCWLFVDGSEPVTLGVGDVVCLPHGAGHALADSPFHVPAEPRTASLLQLDEAPTDETATTVLLCGAYLLDQARPHPLFAELPALIHLPARVGVRPRLRSAVDLLGAELDRPGHGSEAIIPALLDVLLLYMLRAWFDEHSAHTGWVGALGDSALLTSLRAIHSEPNRPWTVESLGAAAGLSRASFAGRFSSMVGQPPLTYLTWWRMTVAARLLRETSNSMRQVAESVGYRSEFAFAKAFKREYGTGPGQYRRIAAASASRDT
jgi:AraC-like DNA-binding protein